MRLFVFYPLCCPLWDLEYSSDTGSALVAVFDKWISSKLIHFPFVDIRRFVRVPH